MINNDNNDLLSISEKLRPIREFISNEPRASLYKDAVLNLIILKYLSDSIDYQFSILSSTSTHFEDDAVAVHQDFRPIPSIMQSLHRKDILWVPKESHWRHIYALIEYSATSRQPLETLRKLASPSIAKIIDDALLKIEKDNVLKQGIFNPISCYQVENIKVLKIAQLFYEINFLSISTSTGIKPDKREVFRFVYNECLNMFTKHINEKREIEYILESARIFHQ